jgi:hypothetical protein
MPSDGGPRETTIERRKRLRKYMRLWRKKHWRKVRRDARRWRNNNRSRVREYERQSRKRTKKKRNARRRVANMSTAMKDRRKKQSRRYYLRHRMEVIRRTRKYRRLHADRKRESDRKYRAANKEKRNLRESKQRRKINSQLRAFRKTAKYRKWYRKNYFKLSRVNPHIRRARLKNVLIGDVKAIRAFIRYVVTVDKITCRWCRRNIPKGKRHVDHIIPISRGGPHSRKNLCCACCHCNWSKGAKLPHEFKSPRR